MTESQRNKEVVLAFLRLAFTERRPVDAFAEHVGESYIQHNPTARRARKPRLATWPGSWPGSRSSPWTSTG